MASDGVLFDEHLFEKELSDMFPVDWLRARARETGLIKRSRKIDPVILFWVLVIGYGTFLQRTLAGLKRRYETASKTVLSDSSWYDRFSPELVRFLHACVVRAMEYLAQEPGRTLSDRLSPFEDVLIQDSTIVRLHENLASVWPATRSRKVAAGLKVGVLTSAVATGPKNVALFAENKSDLKMLRIGRWVKDRILLIDLGFYSYRLFSRIDENGGYFVSRLKSNANPLIIKTNSVHRGRAIDLQGKHLKDVLGKLKREMLDADVEVKFKRRAYRGVAKIDTKRFRIVAVYNEDEDRYHFYITNIPTERLNAEEIAKLYSARWEVEILFKELKSKYALDLVPTSNPMVIEALIWTAILTLLVSRRLYLLIRRLNPKAKIARFTQLRWANSFAENSSHILSNILDYLGLKVSSMTLIEISLCDALDPHANRSRFTDEWWA